MKSFSALAVSALAAIAMLSQPALANQQTEPEGGVVKWLEMGKAIIFGAGAPEVLYEADKNGVMMNITDDNYKDTIFNGEWIINFCSAASAPCADYWPTYKEAAEILNGETNTKFATVWVEENTLLSARFFIPARLPYMIYAKDGEFFNIPYVRNDTDFLVKFVEEEHYQHYAVLDGPMGPYSTLAWFFETYAIYMNKLGSHFEWMPRWMVYMIVGSMSGVVFSLFSGGSNYSSDPSRYPHLNADGTLKKDPKTIAGSEASSSTKTTKTVKSTKKKSKKTE